jgi:hypothetical protein
MWQSGISAIAVGLVLVAYIVAQVQQLTTRPEHEQKVLDALSRARLKFYAKQSAARVLWYRYRLRLLNGVECAVADEYRATIKASAGALRRATAQLRMLPLAGDEQQQEDQELGTGGDDERKQRQTQSFLQALQAKLDAQERSTAELARIVKEQSALLREQSAQLKEQGEALRALLTKRRDEHGSGSRSE